MKRYLIGIVAVLVVGLSGCSNGAEPAGAGSTPPSSPVSERTGAPRPTLTAPKLQPPEQEGRWVNENRPDVVFDPCTWIGDNTMREAGFDPASRKRGEDFVAEWTFLICRFDSEVIDLSVMSGNVSLEEEKEKNGAWQRPTMVNGREATIGEEPGRNDSCTLNFRTDEGAVFVNQRLSIEGLAQQTEPCMGIEETAALIERETREGN